MNKLSATEAEAMEQAARTRDPRWDADPPVNRSLYYEGWRDARAYYKIRPDPQPRQPELEVDDGLGP